MRGNKGLLNAMMAMMMMMDDTTLPSYPSYNMVDVPITRRPHLKAATAYVPPITKSQAQDKSIGRNQRKRRKLLRSNPHLLRSKKFK